ncbi:MAG: Trm112 family protein [Mycobacteriales bacterium]
MKIDPTLLDILACPACRGELRADDAREQLACVDCGRRYPVRDDIPVLLVDEAILPGDRSG